ncbi:AMP-binding protein [Chitinibacteraceae bacterium HSL-7]
MAERFTIAASGTLAFYPDGSALGRAGFDALVATARQTLAALAAPRAVLFDEDRVRFAAWLLAAWDCGITVVLPADDLATTRSALSALPWLGGPLAASSHRGTYHAGAPGVMIYTSGSTGAPSECAKRLDQLVNECQALEAAFGPQLPDDCALAATVPQQHLYGLLFGLLWPLASGRPWLSTTLPYPESLATLPGPQPWALVSGPGLIKRVSAHQRDFAAVFSSGAPLPAACARSAPATFGCAITEVWGSSETGGVAWRNDADAAWQPLPGVGVAIADDGQLSVRSPFLEHDGWMTTSDRAEHSGTGIRLLGRSDRIAKVEGKRVSLSAIEHALLALSGVQAARALLLSGSRDEIGAVLVLDDAGTALRRALGSAAHNRQLRAALAGQLDVLAIPRRWRVVSRLPVNEMGKTPQAQLAALFAPEAAQLIASAGDEATHTRTMHMSPDLRWFDGHFDETPVLAGVVQLDWAISAAREAFGITGDFAGMSQLKFQRLIQPGQTVTLALTWKAPQLAFKWSDDTHTYSSGRVTFAGAGT